MKKIEVNQELLQKVVKKSAAFVLAGTMFLGNNPILLEDKNNSNTVYANEITEESDLVTLNVQLGINLYMNDKGFVPKDVNGNETYPFISEGTTYVPVRAIAELFNANVKWDKNTKTVSITTTGETAKLKHTHRPTQTMYNKDIQATKGAKLVINGKECIPTDVNGNVKDIYVVNGTTYVPVRAISTALGLPITWSNITNSVFIGKHKTEGLTVENVNDVDLIKEAGQTKFYDWHRSAYMYAYDDVIYNMQDTKFEELVLAVAFLNIEYINDDVFYELFKDLDESTIYRYIYSSYMIGASMVKFGTKMYDFSYCVVNPELANNLEELHLLCAEEKYDDACDYIFNYFTNNTQDFYTERYSPYLDHILFYTAVRDKIFKGNRYQKLMYENINVAPNGLSDMREIGLGAIDKSYEMFMKKYNRGKLNANQKLLKK